MIMTDPPKIYAQIHTCCVWFYIAFEIHYILNITEQILCLVIIDLPISFGSRRSRFFLVDYGKMYLRNFTRSHKTPHTALSLNIMMNFLYQVICVHTNPLCISVLIKPIDNVAWKCHCNLRSNCWNHGSIKQCILCTHNGWVPYSSACLQVALCPNNITNNRIFIGYNIFGRHSCIFIRWQHNHVIFVFSFHIFAS